METPDEGRLLLIDKPLEWTSKIGHAGTLDPLATGLLIICLGKMTKRIEEYMGLEKEYTGKFVIGQTTPSHDLETEVSEKMDISGITLVRSANSHRFIRRSKSVANVPINMQGRAGNSNWRRATWWCGNSTSLVSPLRRLHFELSAQRERTSVALPATLEKPLE
jgi:hypothetical protein